MKFTPEKLLTKLPLPATEKWKNGVSFMTVFRRRNLTLEFFAPRGKDYQTPHEEDEFYIIVCGTADLIIETEKFECAVGDTMFVSAHAEHHFENMSSDFATWVVFF